jgi:hypothetical protein
MDFDWAVYSSSNGHFASLITTLSLPFCIALACNLNKSGQALFQEFAMTARIFNSGNNMLNYIRMSGKNLVISSYLINSYWFCTSKVTSSFWKLQLLIIAQLHLIYNCSQLPWLLSSPTTASWHQHLSKASPLPIGRFDCGTSTTLILAIQ